MYRIKANPKQLNKIESLKVDQNSLKTIPKSFSEFCSLINIRSGTKITKFHLYPYQVVLSQCIAENQSTIVVKPRQMGITETIGALFLHKACLNPGYAAVVLSRSQSDTSNIAKRVRRMLDSIPDFAVAENDNLQRIKIKNGGELFFRQSTPDGCRGLESISDIFFDEWAFVKDADRIFDSAIPTTSACGNDARIIMVSTPNGRSGFYWDTLTRGESNDIETIIDHIRQGRTEPVKHWIDSNGWCKYICHWKAHPVYSKNPNYLEDIGSKFKLSNQVVNQEFDLCFTESNDGVFSLDSINRALGDDHVSDFWQ